MFTKKGQVEVGAALRPLAPRRDIDVQVIGAVTDHLRLGLSGSGAVMRRLSTNLRGSNEEPPTKLMAGYVEGVIGVEGMHDRVRYGLLAGAGVGASHFEYLGCIRPAFEWFGCDVSEPRTVRTRYVRAHVQPYLGLAHKRWRGALGVRVPFIDDWWGSGKSLHRFVTAEPFVFHAVRITQHLNVELQAMYSVVNQLHLHLGVRWRFGEDATKPTSR